MSKGKKKPEIGQRITVYDAWTDSWLDGRVYATLSTQFSWESDDGRCFITHYDGGWKHAEEKEK